MIVERILKNTFPNCFMFLTGAQYRHCNYCLEPDAATCTANQRNQVCATDRESFGTSHCASAVLKYEDKDGKVRSGFMRGCINCASKDNTKIKN